MKLSGLHLLLTYQCTFECDHCFVWGSPWQTGTMTLEDIRHIVREAQDLGTITSLYFEGGEPFLYYATLLAGVRLAREAGFEVGIVSNSYWEGMQNALVEAMATGCYCLAHFWEGVEEILPDEYIYIAPADLEEKIAAYCGSAEATKWAHQAELRTIVEERFNLPAMLARMRAIVTQADRATPGNEARQGKCENVLTPARPVLRARE